MEDGTFMIVDDKPNHQTAQSQTSLPLFAMGISMLSFAAVLGARFWRGMQPPLQQLRLRTSWSSEVRMELQKPTDGCSPHRK